MEKILDVQNASKLYGSQDNAVVALKNVSFTVEPGEFLGIMGSSGCGKSTLLNVISTIDSVTDGCVLMGGESMAELSENELAAFRRNYLGFVFQEYNLLDTLTLRENIALALTIQNREKSYIAEAIPRVAAKLGIDAVLDKYPYEVSGGQRQRCACARAVAVEPNLILADEPTGALDSVSAKNLMEAFLQLNRELGATILMVTHDAFSACYCERILFMKDGEIVSMLKKNGLDNLTFMKQILDILSAINGGGANVC